MIFPFRLRLSEGLWVMHWGVFFSFFSGVWGLLAHLRHGAQLGKPRTLFRQRAYTRRSAFFIILSLGRQMIPNRPGIHIHT
jgi:hypothetical protein